jgi:hypothetical protein
MDIKLKSAIAPKPAITLPKGNQETKVLATNITETLDLEKSAVRKLKVEVAKLKPTGAASKYVPTINQQLTEFQKSLNLKTSGTGTAERLKLYGLLSKTIEDHFTDSETLSGALSNLKAHLDAEENYRNQRADLNGAAEVGGAKVTNKPMPVVSTKSAVSKKSAAVKGGVEQMTKEDLAEIGKIHSKIAKQLRALKVQVNGLASTAFTPGMPKVKLVKMVKTLIDTHNDEAILDHETKASRLQEMSAAVESILSKAKPKAKAKVLQILSELNRNLESEEAMFKELLSRSPDLSLSYDKDSGAVTQQ